MSLEDIETRSIYSLRDFYPTENYNVIAVADDHLFDIKDPYEKAERIEEEIELINQAGKAFNASTYFNLADSGGAESMARLLEGLHTIDEAVILEGDEDKKKGDGRRDLGWVKHPQEIGELMEDGPVVRTGEEFVVDVFPEYDILLDHYPGTPNKNEERNFQYEWWADDLYYQGTENIYPEAFREPKVALTGHVHAPYARTLASAIAINNGSINLNSNTTDALPERNFYAISFGPRNVQTAMIDVDTGEITEYDLFKIENESFIHEFSYSANNAHHPEQRFSRGIIEDKYDNGLIDTTERLYPREITDVTAAD